MIQGHDERLLVDEVGDNGEGKEGRHGGEKRGMTGTRDEGKGREK